MLMIHQSDSVTLKAEQCQLIVTCDQHISQSVTNKPVVKCDDCRECSRDDTKTADHQMIETLTFYTDIHTHRQTHIETYRQTYTHTEILSRPSDDRNTDVYTDTYTQAHTHTDTQTDTHRDSQQEQQTDCQHHHQNKLIIMTPSTKLHIY